MLESLEGIRGNKSPSYTQMSELFKKSCNIADVVGALFACMFILFECLKMIYVCIAFLNIVCILRAMKAEYANNMEVKEMSNLEIAENFDSNLETVEPRFFLEDLLGISEVEMAPAMEIQTQEISEAFLENPELQYENWKELSPQGRVNALQNFECEVAKIVYRDVLPVKSGDLGNCVYGQYSPYTNDITVSESLINSNSQEDYLQTLNTYFHESRHAYQFYNLLTERIEPNSELYESWNINLNVLGYNPGDYGLFGYEEYYTQPVEVDARVFAQEVMDKLELR